MMKILKMKRNKLFVILVILMISLLPSSLFVATNFSVFAAEKTQTCEEFAKPWEKVSRRKANEEKITPTLNFFLTKHAQNTCFLQWFAFRQLKISIAKMAGSCICLPFFYGKL